MSNFKSNQNTFSIPCSIDYFRFGPGIGWYRYQVIGNRPSLASRMASETSRNRILTEFLNVSMEKNLNNVVETFIGPK